MASQWSDLKFELLEDGATNWGTNTNANIGTAIEQAIVGMATISSGFTGSPLTLSLTLTNTTALQNARALVLNLTQALGSAGTLEVPAIEKPYMVINATGQTITVKVSGGTGVAVPTGRRAFLYNNGTDVGNFFTYADTLALGSALPVTSGGTGTTTSTGTGSVVLSTSPTLVTPILGTVTSGNLGNCTVDGTNLVGFKNVPQNSQSTDYLLIASDAGKQIIHPSSDNNTRIFTIPANSSVSYPIGTAIAFINFSVAALTIAINTDTLYLSPGGATGSRSLAQYGLATAVKIGATEWLILGSGLT